MTLSERYEEQIKMSAQQAMIEGRLEGKLEGKLEGIEDKTRRVAVKMLKMGVAEQQVRDYLDISIDKLNAIKLELEEAESHPLH